MPWTVTATQDEEVFFDDVIVEILTTDPAPLPSSEQRVGHVSVEWWQREPGSAFIRASGGSPYDRRFAEAIVAAELEGHGIRRASIATDYDPAESLQEVIAAGGNPRYSTWDDVMAKAKRLIQSGKVQLLRNGPTTIVANVQGDHGNYQPEIGRDDPNSRAITTWQCQCKWDDFAFQRTRQWKKYEGRPCSHVLAAYWSSLATPLDEDVDPAGGGQPGQMSLFSPGGPQAPGAESFPRAPAFPQNPGQEQFPGMESGGAPGAAGPPPGPADVLPQFPMDPALQPQVNPASVPGQRQPSPTDPIQYPGPATFSKVWDIPSWKLGSMPRVSDDAFVPNLNTNPTYTNGDLVSNRYADEGTWVGRSEAHGAGLPAKLPPMLVGEVLGTHPATGMVNVYYTGPAKGNTFMEPHGVSAWHWPSDLISRPDVRPPGPAIRRR